MKTSKHFYPSTPTYHISMLDGVEVRTMPLVVLSWVWKPVLSLTTTMGGVYEFYDEMTKAVPNHSCNEMYCVEDMDQRGLTDEEKKGLTATEVREKTDKDSCRPLVVVS